MNLAPVKEAAEKLGPKISKSFGCYTRPCGMLAARQTPLARARKDAADTSGYWGTRIQFEFQGLASGNDWA